MPLNLPSYITFFILLNHAICVHFHVTIFHMFHLDHKAFRKNYNNTSLNFPKALIHLHSTQLKRVFLLYFTIHRILHFASNGIFYGNYQLVCRHFLLKLRSRLCCYGARLHRYISTGYYRNANI